MKNKLPHRLLSYLNKAEDYFLVGLLSAMVLLAVSQIILRNFFDFGIVWADPLLRIMVLWVALAGAIIATRTDNHIHINIFTRYFSKTYCKYVQRFVYAISVLVCSIIAWHAVTFVRMDYKYATIAFADVPAWITELIIPVGFAMMAFRFALLYISPPPIKN